MNITQEEIRNTNETSKHFTDQIQFVVDPGRTNPVPWSPIRTSSTLLVTFLISAVHFWAGSLPLRHYLSPITELRNGKTYAFGRPPFHNLTLCLTNPTPVVLSERRAIEARYRGWLTAG